MTSQVATENEYMSLRLKRVTASDETDTASIAPYIQHFLDMLTSGITEEQFIWVWRFMFYYKKTGIWRRFKPLLTRVVNSFLTTDVSGLTLAGKLLSEDDRRQLQLILDEVLEDNAVVGEMDVLQAHYIHSEILQRMRTPIVHNADRVLIDETEGAEDEFPFDLFLSREDGQFYLFSFELKFKPLPEPNQDE